MRYIDRERAKEREMYRGVGREKAREVVKVTSLFGSISNLSLLSKYRWFFPGDTMIRK